METGVLIGIRLLDDVGQQVILQYVDDTNLILVNTQQNLENAITLLDLFHLVSGLFINWTKSVAYWLFHEPPQPSLALQGAIGLLSINCPDS